MWVMERESIGDCAAYCTYLQYLAGLKEIFILAVKCSVVLAK